MANYNVNYNDQRFSQVEAEKQNKLNEANNIYNNMIANSDNHYNELIQASKDYANTQQQNQQARTDFTIEEINQQKEKTKKDYIKEQMGAYADWQKESNRYGVNAEIMASQGLQNSGYSESSQVNMYNTYQNRIMQARESYNQAVQNYNNKITEARLTNNEALAEIAYNALQNQLQLALDGFQYKNTLLQSQLSTQQTIENNYYQKYQDVLSQINAENQFKYQQERDRIADSQWQKQYALSKSKASNSNNTVSTVSGKENESENAKFKKLYENLEKAQPKDNISKTTYRNLIYNEVKNQNITEAEASSLFDEFNL